MQAWMLRIGLVALAGATLLLMAGPTVAQQCGLGPQLINRDRGIVLQSLGATTNATSLGTQTLAITSGTSGCSNDGIIKQGQELELYVSVNFDPLAADMARGSGDHLAAMAELMGCSSRLLPVFAEAIRQEVEPFLDQRDRPQIAAAQLRTALAERPALGGCTQLS